MNKNKTFISMFGVDTNLFKKSRKIFADKFIYKVGSNRKLEKNYDVLTFLEAAKSCKKRDDIYFYIVAMDLAKIYLSNLL